MSNGGGRQQPANQDNGHRKISGAVKLIGTEGIITVGKSAEVVQAEERAAEEVRARENQRDLRDRRKHRLDVYTLIFAAVAGVATFGQFFYLRETVLETHNAERPYLLSDGLRFLGPKQVPAQEVPGRPETRFATGFEILFDNFGKSPALNVKVSSNYFWDDQAEDMARGWFRALPFRPTKPKPTADIVPPSNSRDGSFRVTVLINPEQLPLMTIKGRAYVVAYVVYQDGFGKSYSQNECRIYDSDTDTSYNCPWNVIHPESPND